MAYKFDEDGTSRWMDKHCVIGDDGVWFITPTEELYCQAVVGMMYWKSVEEFEAHTGTDFTDIQDCCWTTIGSRPVRVYTKELPEDR